MSVGITYEIAQAKLTLWLDAEARLATSQQYEIQGADGGRRMLRRADLAEVREQIKYWDGQCKALAGSSGAGGGRRRVRYIVPE